MAKKMVVDEQTGIEFELEDEKVTDFISAGISLVYSVLILLFFLWLLFDIWYKDYKLISFFGYDTSKTALDLTVFRLLAFTFIGGCLGGAVASIRSIIYWHCEKKGFGGRFIYKHLSHPWIGGVLALFNFALIRSGISILGGEFAGDATLLRQTLSSFAIGALSGYGSRQVYKWFDSQVKRIFHVASRKEVETIPDLIGKTKEEAEAILKNAGLKIGKDVKRKAKKDEKIGTIVEQDPKAGKPKGDTEEVMVIIAS